MTSRARATNKILIRIAAFLVPEWCAVVWRYTSPIKGEVLDVRIVHRYIVFARSFFWKRGRLIGLLFSAACWYISGKLSQSQHNDFESFASSQCRACSHRDDSHNSHIQYDYPMFIDCLRRAHLISMRIGNRRLLTIIGSMTVKLTGSLFLRDS